MSDRPALRWRGPLGALALVSFALQLGVLASMSLPELVRMIPDDSFFYLVIGQHLRDLGRFTFDGVQETYGFQPLYQLVVAALAVVFRDPLHLLYGALVLQSVLHVAAGCGLARLVRPAFGATGAWAAAVFWLLNPALVAWCWGLKENALYALLLVGLFLELQRLLTSGSTPARGVRLGVLAGLAALTRVNFALLALAVAVPLLLGLGVPRPPKERGRILLVAAACAALLAGPWFVFAALHFGTALPTSGLVKLASERGYVREVLGMGWLSLDHIAWGARGTPDYLDRTFRSGSGLYGPLLQGLVLAAVAGWLLGRRRSRAPDPPGASFATPAAWTLTYVAGFAATNAFLNVLLLPSFILYGQWYTAPEFVALTVGVGWAAGLGARHLRSGVGALVLAGSLVVGILGWTAVRRVPWSARFTPLDFLEEPPPSSLVLLEVGLWAGLHLPEDGRVGVRDPGIVAFFSRRRLHALDPLVASLEYIRDRRHDQVAYVREQGLSYVLGPGTVRDGRFELLSLPAGSYEVVWVPYPDFDLGWRAEAPTHYMLARPLDTPGPAFLGPEDFGFGLYRPNREGVDGRRPGRALPLATAREGFPIDADVIRLRVRPAAVGEAEGRLWVGEEAVKRTRPGPDGWIHWDVSALRGRRARVEVASPHADPVEDLFAVDYAFPPPARR